MSVDQNTVEESKKPVQRAMLSDKSLAEVEATLTEEERAKVTEIFNAEIGFTKVIQIMIDAKKPIIAHNPQYDVGYLFEMFIAPTPPTYLEFCETWRKNFPLLYDTKCIFYDLT